MSRIHPTAIVENGASLGTGVEIGPYCHVSADTTLDEGVRLMSHVVVAGTTRIGSGTVVHPFAVLGLPPQHAKYAGETVSLEIGARNIIRESVTMHAGTPEGGGVTQVGDGGMFMVNSHVGHDCRVGDGVIFANNVALGGHVVVGDGVFLGGAVVVHQNCRIGSYAFVGGMTGMDADIIPNGMVRGVPAYLGGLNIVGMRRRGMERERIRRLWRAYRMVFHGGGTIREQIDRTAEAFGGDADVDEMLAFLRAPAKRPLCTPVRKSIVRQPEDDTA